MKNTCIFTIVSWNYLHYARTLMQSVEKYSDGAELIVVICDKPNVIEEKKECFSTLNISELDISDFTEFVFRYNILELNTAVKPFVFSHFMSKGFSKIIYFDPDIQIFSSLIPMVNLLSQHNILLTPHLTGELNDGKRPGELDILRAGTYNLGFIATNNDPESKRFINWWMVRLRKQCINDVAKGLFVDQKWVELVPGLFKGVFINQNPGWNAAYWNMNHREITKDRNGLIQANKELLIFFHFSGFKHMEKILSVHQDRYSISDCNPVLRVLFDDYAKDLKSNDHDGVSSTIYGYGHFGDGSGIPDILRETYRKLAAPVDQLPPFTLDQPPEWLVDLMNKPKYFDTHCNPYVTTLGYEIYVSRPDLREAFPEIEKRDSRAYGGWFIASIKSDYGLSSQFAKSVLDAVGDEALSESPTQNLGRSLFLKYHRTTVLPKIAGRLLKSSTRKKLRRLLLNSNHDRIDTELSETKPVELNPELNVLGYLFAESGTGEAARSTIRACNSAEINVAGIDIRSNNISRMREVPDVQIELEPIYDINLFHINADQTQNILESIDVNFHLGRYNIGFWFWELEKLPSEFINAYDFLDEIWVASSFCQNAVSKIAAIPVTRIPLCIDLPPSTLVSKSDLGIPDEPFLVFASMDMLSIPERKNPLGVLQAFEKLYNLTKVSVHLVLKFSNFEKCDAQLQQKILKYTERLPVTLIDRYLERQELTNIMSVCNCVLSMHRSEGFGLPIAEAMFLNKPVVATGWSSNMDFMNINNSYPVMYELVTLDRDYGPYKKGNVWAEPDTGHAAQCLLEVLENPADAARKAAQASVDIRQFNSPQFVGQLIKERLNTISKQNQTPA